MATASATTSAVVAIVAVVPVGMVQMVVGRERHPGPVPRGRTPRVRPPRGTGMSWIHGWLVGLFLKFLNRHRFFVAGGALSSTDLCPPVFGLKLPLATHCTVPASTHCAFFSRQTTSAGGEGFYDRRMNIFLLVFVDFPFLCMVL